MKIITGNSTFIVEFNFTTEPFVAESLAPSIAKVPLEHADAKELRHALKVLRRNAMRKANPSRTSTCTIHRATSDTESVELGKLPVKNHTDELFVKAVGRKEAFTQLVSALKITSTITPEEAEGLTAGFFVACPRSRMTYNTKVKAKVH